MKFRTLLLPCALALLAVTAVRAQDTQAPAQPAQGAAALVQADAENDLKALVTKIQAKLQTGQRSEAALAPELAQFDALVAKYKGKDNEAASEIALLRATLYLQVFNDATKGRQLLEQIKADFPDTKIGGQMDRYIAMIDAQQKAAETEMAVVGKPAPELHFIWSTRPDLKKLSDLKGKVVVLDFWATWCGPCIHSFPQMRQLVEHYKGSDVVIVGVTSLQGRVMNLEPQPIDTKGDPQKEISLMPDFIKKLDMTWTVAVSKEEVFNPDYGITGIPHMTIIAPDGTVRFNNLHPAMPEAMKTEKIDAILKEFHLPLPAAAKT